MLPDFMKPKSEAEKQQVKDLSEAEESGLFDKDYVGKSEIERDMVKDAPTSHLKSILALESDDLRKSDIQFIENELASRGEDLTKVEDDVVIEDTATNKVQIETANEGAGNPYGTANIVTTQDNSVKAKTDNTYIGQGNSAYGSDANAWASMGYGGGSKYWGSI